jgi:hypothetical protein
VIIFTIEKLLGLVDIGGARAIILLAPGLAILLTRILVVIIFTIEKPLGLVDIGAEG